MTPLRAEIDPDLVVDVNFSSAEEDGRWMNNLVVEAEKRTGKKVIGVIIDRETAHLAVREKNDDNQTVFYVLVDNGKNDVLPVLVGENSPELRVDWGKGEVAYLKMPSSQEANAYFRDTGGSVWQVSFSIVSLGRIDSNFYPVLRRKLERVTNQRHNKSFFCARIGKWWKNCPRNMTID